MATIDRTIFFDAVRPDPFPNALTQSQVDGMEAILDAWEADFSLWDLRWLAYCLATTVHETAFECLPIEEYGKGEGMSYGKPDPNTGETYYGRGYVQLTWGDNYKRADSELHLAGDQSCYLHADNALDPEYAAAIMFKGMSQGWFRSNSGGQPNTLQMFFNDTRDDPYGAREIINGDKHIVPKWSNGVSIGNLIAGYHKAFLDALSQAYVEDPGPPFVVEPAPGMHETVYRVTITGEGPFTVTVVEEKSGPA
jgi:hypothetical protein